MAYPDDSGVPRDVSDRTAVFAGTDSADGAGAWRHPELLRQGLSLLPSTLADRQDVDGLFAFARSGLFLRAQADESARLGNSQRGIPI